MRAYLHLYDNIKPNSRMYQVLDEDYVIEEGETFLYDKTLFNELDEDAKKTFEESGLYVGEYTVIKVDIQKSEYWGDLRILHLKPINNKTVDNKI